MDHDFINIGNSFCPLRSRVPYIHIQIEELVFVPNPRSLNRH